MSGRQPGTARPRWLPGLGCRDDDCRDATKRPPDRPHHPAGPQPAQARAPVGTAPRRAPGPATAIDIPCCVRTRSWNAPDIPRSAAERCSWTRRSALLQITGLRASRNAANPWTHVRTVFEPTTSRDADEARTRPQRPAAGLFAGSAGHGGPLPRRDEARARDVRSTSARRWAARPSCAVDRLSGRVAPRAAPSDRPPPNNAPLPGSSPRGGQQRGVGRGRVGAWWRRGSHRRGSQDLAATEGGLYQVADRTRQVASVGLDRASRRLPSTLTAGQRAGRARSPRPGDGPRRCGLDAVAG